MHRCKHTVLGAHIKYIHWCPRPWIQTCQQPRIDYQLNNISPRLSYHIHQHHIPFIIITCRSTHNHINTTSCGTQMPQSYPSQDITIVGFKPPSLTHHRYNPISTITTTKRYNYTGTPPCKICIISSPYSHVQLKSNISYGIHGYAITQLNTLIYASY